MAAKVMAMAAKVMAVMAANSSGVMSGKPSKVVSGIPGHSKHSKKISVSRKIE